MEIEYAAEVVLVLDDEMMFIPLYVEAARDGEGIFADFGGYVISGDEEGLVFWFERQHSIILKRLPYGKALRRLGKLGRFCLR